MNHNLEKCDLNFFSMKETRGCLLVSRLAEESSESAVENNNIAASGGSETMLKDSTDARASSRTGQVYHFQVLYSKVMYDYSYIRFLAFFVCFKLKYDRFSIRLC